MTEYTIAVLYAPVGPAFQEWLSSRLPVRFIPKEQYMEADFLICDTMGYEWEKFPGVRILLTGENHAPDLNNFDYCLTHELRETDRCHRFPYWLNSTLFMSSPEERAALTEPRAPITAEELRAQQRGFCAFVSYNAAAKKRVRMVQALMKRRHVSCGGPLFNNIGYRVQDKRAFLSQHLFSVAYENEASCGYQTEKLADALVARSIPIYWGNKAVEEEFNPDAFIHARRYRSESAMLDAIVALSEDYERMAAMLNAHPLRDPQAVSKGEEALLAFFTKIIERGPKAVQRTRLQKVLAFLSQFYGHGFFRTFRRVSRRLRGKTAQG